MNQQPKMSGLPMPKVIAAIALVVVIGSGGFVGGMQYQKSHTTSKGQAAFNSANGVSGAQGFQARRGMRSGAVGTVSAVSSSSVTVNDQRTNSTKSFTISSSTVISDNGSTVTTSDIQVGDTVFVSTSSATSTDATRILVNPSMGGFGGQSGSSTNGSSSSIGSGASST